MLTLRTKLIHLAHANPNLRPQILPLLKTAAKIIDSNSKLAVVNLSSLLNGLDFQGKPSITKSNETVVEVKIPAGMNLKGDTSPEMEHKGTLYFTIEMIDEDTIGLTYRLVDED